MNAAAVFGRNRDGLRRNLTFNRNAGMLGSRRRNFTPRNKSMIRKWTNAVTLASLAWSSVAAAKEPTLNGATFVASIKPIQETTSDSTNAPDETFRFDQPLTVRVFFKDTLQNLFFLTKTAYRLDVEERFVCGKNFEMQRVNIWVPKRDFDKKFLDLEVVPDPVKAHTKYQDENGATLIGWAIWDDKSKCVKAATSLVIRVSPYSSPGGHDFQLPPLKIDFSGADLEKAKKMDQQAKEAGMAAFSSNLALPTAGMKDATLEAKLVALWKKNMGGAVKRARAILLSTGWGVEVDDNKRPISRGVDVTMISQKQDGKCFMDSVAVNESAAGKGFGPPSFASQGQSESQVDCKKGFGGK